jgi:hypothetical protein
MHDLRQEGHEDPEETSVDGARAETGQYKRMFKIPKDVDLVAPKYAAARRQMAIDRGLPEKLAAARALRKKKAE